MLDTVKLTKDINKIYDKYPYKKGKIPFNLDRLEREVGFYVRAIQEQLNNLSFSEKCQEMDKVYKIINELEHQKFGVIK
jgi:hypothetical protein